jgi:DNA-binding NtrC family response regulator
MPPRALVVDDDATFQSALSDLVREEGFTVTTASTLAQARTALAAEPPDVVLLDLNLPDGTGIDLLREREGGSSEPEFVLITGNGTVDSAVDALKHGAADYLTKPADMHRLRAVLVNVGRRRELRGEIGALRTELRTLGRFGALIGASPPRCRHVTTIASGRADRRLGAGRR